MCEGDLASGCSNTEPRQEGALPSDPRSRARRERAEIVIERAVLLHHDDNMVDIGELSLPCWRCRRRSLGRDTSTAKAAADCRKRRRGNSSIGASEPARKAHS